MMRQKEIVVRCVYSKGGSSLAELLEQSFRLILKRVLTGGV